MSLASVLTEIRRSELAKLEAEGKITVVGNLKISNVPLGDAGKRWVRIWSGKAAKPYANYSFNSAAFAEKYIADQITADAEATAAKAVYKAAKAEAKAKAVESIQVGTILDYAWGWEQTNVDFFQVVEKRGATVTLRPIASETVPGSEYPHGMACKVRPVKDKFCGEPFTKRINGHGVTMPHGIASPCAEGSEHYCSWYA